MNKIIIEQVAKHRKEAETLVRAFYDPPEISMEETASSRWGRSTESRLSGGPWRRIVCLQAKATGKQGRG